MCCLSYYWVCCVLGVISTILFSCLDFSLFLHQMAYYTNSFNCLTILNVQSQYSIRCFFMFELVHLHAKLIEVSFVDEFFLHIQFANARMAASNNFFRFHARWKRIIKEVHRQENYIIGLMLCLYVSVIQFHVPRAYIRIHLYIFLFQATWYILFIDLISRNSYFPLLYFHTLCIICFHLTFF